MPVLTTCPLEAATVAERIYRDMPHETTTTGVIIEGGVKRDFERFLEAFIAHSGCPPESYFRVDAFLRPSCLEIVEINVECQEGWGIGLNLLRAAGYTMRAADTVHLPREVIEYEDEYLPEFSRFVRESEILGRAARVVPASERPGVPARSNFDSKMYLAEFARVWNGTHPRFSGECYPGTRVPMMYSVYDTPWSDLPTDVIFKYCVKYLPDGTRLRQSVATRAEIGKGKHMRRCYEESRAVAQDRMRPLTLADGRVTQAIIMCAGARAVTGYLQVAPPDTFIINDRTGAKGPLVFE